MEANSIDSLISAAADAFREGNMAAVERFCNRILELDASRLDALHLLRLIANGKGDLEQELKFLKRILSANPDHVESLNGLGDALRKQGQPALGIEPCLRALELRPSYANAYNTLGLCYFETGALSKAAQCFERAIGLVPTLVAAYVNLGAALKKLERNGDAIRCYRKVIQLAPNSSEAQEALGLLLVQLHRPQEAMDCFRKVLQMNPSSVKAHLLVADTLQQQGFSDKAYAFVQKALAINPNSGQAHCMLGFVKVDLGEFEAGKASFERSIALLPDQADAYLGLVTSKKITNDDLPLVNQMEMLLRDHHLTPTDQAQLHSALAKSFDDLKEYEKAMTHADEGNRIGLGLEGGARAPGSAEAAKAYLEKTIATFTPDYYRQHPGLGIDSELPIFIVGLPRSGTTLLEQILSCHSQVAAGGELRFWDDMNARTPNHLIGLASDPAATKSAAEDYVRRISSLDPAARFVIDKYNDNFFNLGFLHLALPNARVIHCRRNPLDNCVSLYMTPFKRKNPLFRSREGILDYYYQHSKLMAHWRKILPPERLLEVDYEEVVANREEVTRRVIAFCGLEWEGSCLRHEENKRVVNTPSKWQARQAVYKTSVERWRGYEPWLGAFRELMEKPREA